MSKRRDAGGMSRQQYIVHRVNCKHTNISSSASLIQVKVEPTPSQKCSGIARVFKGLHSFTCTPMRLSTNGMKPYLPMPSQPKLVLIYGPRRDGRLSWPDHHHGEYCTGPLRDGNHRYQPLRASRLTGQLETQTATSVELVTSCAVIRDANHYASD